MAACDVPRSAETSSDPPPSLRLAGITRGERVAFTWNGLSIEAYEGETIGTALLASGRRTCRETPRGRSPRGLFCAMGVCFDCIVVVDGVPGKRACMTPVRAGMAVTSPAGPEP